MEERAHVETNADASAPNCPPSSPAQAAATAARDAFIGRLLAGHFAAYPMTFAAAMAGMSLSIIAQEKKLLAVSVQLEPTSAAQRWLIDEVGLGVVEAASFEVIMLPLGWVLLVIFVVSHVASLPWALAGRRAAADPERRGASLDRARKRWLWASLGTTGAVVLAGAVGWAVILLA